MVTLTIDGREVTVAPGTTVLAAARQAGIRIPTLCHVEGLEPVSSCFICAVQVEGQRNLSPACGLPVAGGMVVTTDCADVRTARKTAIELLLSDHAGDCVAPCAATCPAGLDIQGFVYELARRDSRRATEVISRRLALAGSLGRICPRLCEQQCRRCDLDTGLAIGALHRFAVDQDVSGGSPFLPARAPATGKRVAIVGAGPAGLAAAYYLQIFGHACTLYDAKPAAGGMLRYGIPAHRLPKQALDTEIGLVEALGAEFRMGVRWGSDFTLAELRRKHDAVFLAIGAQRPQELRCEGEELALPAVEFLDRLARGNPPALGQDVVVVGGGNTAIDCARAAVRLGASSVRILYRRTRQEMPCLWSEAEDAMEEGASLEFLVAPVRIERNGNGGLALTCQRMQLGAPDSSGRRRPVPVEGSEFTLSCSAVIGAIGQAVETALAEREGLRVTGWGIAADERTLATGLSGVFAGGDAVLGADLAVRAVAAGRIAANSIHQFLSRQPVAGAPEQAGVSLKPMDDDERARLFRDIEQAARVRVPTIEMSRRRTSFEEVEAGLPQEAAEQEARRCLSCGCRKQDCCHIRSLATEYGAEVYLYAGARRRFARDDSHPEVVYEPGKCIMCEACVRVAAAAGEAIGVTTSGRGFDVAVAAPFGAPLSAALAVSARLCASACPTGALALRTPRACDLVQLGSR
jgi:formate dehydrogenase major subunit